MIGAHAVYVLRTDKRRSETPIPGVYDALRKGQARIGWSYKDDLDLRIIENTSASGRPLKCYQKDAKRCLRFYTEVKIGDYLIYPHQPSNQFFCVVTITGEYDYLPEKEGIDSRHSLKRDFRSFRLCKMITPYLGIHRDDPFVPRKMSRRIRTPGRFTIVKEPKPFWDFLKALDVKERNARP